MRKCTLKPEEVKSAVGRLKGKLLKISVNRGRKKISRYEGEVESTYPSVFILKIINQPLVKSLSFSYSDVICGDVKLRIKKTAEN